MMIPQLIAASGLGAAGALAKMEQDRRGSEQSKKSMEREEYKDKQTREADAEKKRESRGMKKGGKIKSASARADGCAQRGKTRGRIV
jgi:hypothetical protein